MLSDSSYDSSGATSASSTTTALNQPSVAVGDSASWSSADILERERSRLEVLGDGSQEVCEYAVGGEKVSFGESFEETDVAQDGGGKNILGRKVSWEGKKVCSEVGGGEGLGDGMCFEIPELSASRIVLRSAGQGYTGPTNSDETKREASMTKMILSKI